MTAVASSPTPPSTRLPGDGGHLVPPQPRPRFRRRVAAPLLLIGAIGSIVISGAVALSQRHGIRSASTSGAPILAATAAESLAALDVAARAKPDDLAGWQRLATALVSELGRTGNPSDVGRAQEALGRATALAPNDPSTFVTQAALAATLHRFADALALTQTVLAAMPANADALAIAVDSLVELGRYEEATTTLQRLLDRRPALAALARASYLRELHGDLDGALVAMTQAEVAGGGGATLAPGATNGTLATVIALQGDILWAQGRPGEAATRYARSADLAPNLPLAEIGLARTTAASGDPTSAVARLRKAVNRYPTPGALTLLVDLQLLAGDSAGAAQTVELLRATTQLAEAAGSVVDVEIAAFELDCTAPCPASSPNLALARAEKAYRDRRTVHTADVLAWAYYRTGQPKQAEPYLTEALRLGTRDAATLARAATIYRSEEHTSELQSR